MKKTYINPQTVCVKVQTQCILADSLQSLGENGGVVGTNSDELPEGIVSDSRRRSIWDDED